jgi:WhiB family redox-sensing transcriptional regulator
MVRGMVTEVIHGGATADASVGSSVDSRASSPGVIGRTGAGELVEPGVWIDDEGEELTELAWQERALCAQTDPEAFFPEKGGSTREAKKVCLGCEVRGDCLEYALAHDERFGIWGGLSERERRRLKKEAV